MPSNTPVPSSPIADPAVLPANIHPDNLPVPENIQIANFAPNQQTIFQRPPIKKRKYIRKNKTAPSESNSLVVTRGKWIPIATSVLKIKKFFLQS